MILEIYHQFTDYYDYFLNAELHINEWVQDHLSFAEPLFRFVSIYLEPSNIFNVLIPLIGVYRQDLLTHLICVMSLVSTVGSFEKWIYPESRPLWRLRELYADENPNKPTSGIALQSHDLSCETSGGLPCSHSMCLTALLMVLTTHLSISHRLAARRMIVYGLIGCCVLCMWLSRLYLATEYLHQCLLGSYMAISIVAISQRHWYTHHRCWAVLVVTLLGCLAVAVYFLKLHLGLDPHWSVRQAFKWCPEPTFMRHESSPIFLLSRDLGNLMGIALAKPSKEMTNNSKYSHRLAGISILELVNYLLRLYTPKQNGRFLFLAYEFTRNSLHSLVLIKFLPQILNKLVK